MSRQGILNDNIRSISRLTLGFAYTVRIRTLPVTTRTQDLAASDLTSHDPPDLAASDLTSHDPCSDLEKKLSLQSLDKEIKIKTKRTVSPDFGH